MSKVDVAVPLIDSDDGGVGTRRDEVMQDVMEELKDTLGTHSHIFSNHGRGAGSFPAKVAEFELPDTSNPFIAQRSCSTW